MAKIGICPFIPLPLREGRKNPKPLWYRPWPELDPHEPGNFHKVYATGLTKALYAAARLRKRRGGQLSLI